MVEVNVDEHNVTIDVTRFLKVDRKECMSSNAQLAKYDALPSGNNFVNCHQLLREVIGEIRGKFADNTCGRNRIILKKSQVFGRPGK